MALGAVAAFAVLAAGGLAYAATTWDYEYLAIPGHGGYNCTVARTAEQAPYFTVHVTYVANGSTLNYFSGTGCTQGTTAGSGGTQKSGYQAIPNGETVTWDVGDGQGQNIQLWIGTDLDASSTSASGTWTP